MGVKLDNDEWYNGGDEDIPEMSKGDKLTIEHDDGWIKEIDIMEEDSEGGEQTADNSDAETGSGRSNFGKSSSSQNLNMSGRQASIMANSSVKMAVENTETDYSDDPKQHIDEVQEKSQAYQNIMKQRLGENL